MTNRASPHSYMNRTVNESYPNPQTSAVDNMRLYELTASAP